MAGDREEESPPDGERIRELVEEQLRSPMTVVHTTDNIGALVYQRSQTEHPNAVPPDEDTVRLDRQELSEFVALGRRQEYYTRLKEEAPEDLTNLNGEPDTTFKYNDAGDPVVTAAEFEEITEREGHHRQLHRFEEAGLIEQFVLDAPKPGAMQETGYRLTSKGEDELEELKGWIPPAGPEHALADFRNDIETEVERAIYLGEIAQRRMSKIEGIQCRTRGVVATMLELMSGLDRESVVGAIELLEEIRNTATRMDISPGELVVAMAVISGEMDGEAVAERVEQLDIDPPAFPDPSDEEEFWKNFGWDHEPHS